MSHIPHTEGESATDTPPVQAHPCRRCRKPVEPTSRKCPACGAVVKSAVAASDEGASSQDETDRAMITVCVCYGVILAVSVCFGIATSFSADDTRQGSLPFYLFFDACFIGATFVAWWKTRKVPVFPDSSTSPTKAWLLAIPMLAIALECNFTYHQILTNIFHLPVKEDYYSFLGPLGVIVAIVCVEPALVEEFFFRGIVWKTFRGTMGAHGTVLVTSVMFAMAHIGVPLSIPVLFGVGIMLGYARLWSGGLLLPMLLHFLHNFVIVLNSEL